MTHAHVRLLRPTLLLALLASLPAVPCAHAEEATALVFPGTPTIERKVGDRTVTTPRHTFGVVAQQADVTATIPYRNDGATPLKGIRVSSGCSCFGATLSDRELAPGATGTMTLRFRSGRMKGTVTKPLRLLYLADGAKGMAELRIEAKVIAGVLVERVWFGEVRAGSKPTASAPLAWFHEVGTPFEIEKIEVPGPKMSTRVEPYEIAGGRTYRGWRIHFTFEEPPPKGVYSRKAIIHTNHPEHPTVIVPLHATVVGALWVQSSRVFLGLVPEGVERSASVKVKASGKDAPPLKSVRVKARGGVLKTSVKDGFDPFVGPHKVITVTVPKGTPAGALDDVLEVRTDLSGDEVTEIQVLGRVFTPKGP